MPHNLLELAANATYAVSVFLAARNSVHTWWIGILGCILFGLLFYDSRLYADVVLQFFFVGTSLVGWLGWAKAFYGLPIRTSSRDQILGSIALSVAVTAAWGWMLHRYTDAYAPFADSAILVGSVAAQILLMRRRIETWYAWILVDLVAVPLYASRGLVLTALLYAAFTANAFVGLQRWRSEMRRVQAAQGVVAASPGGGQG
jgi:nicotinamide mononucleotide transporter